MNKKTKYHYAVYLTAFHGGRFVSRHGTLEAAEKVVKNIRGSDCVCGCAGVINELKGERPGREGDQSPFAIGSVIYYDE